MSIRALMVDVDGVVVVHPDLSGWSATLERDLGLSAARLQEAFFVRWAPRLFGMKTPPAFRPAALHQARIVVEP